MKKLVYLLAIATMVCACGEKEDAQEPRMEQVEVELSERAGEAVDLGLSVLWASDNVAGRFAWGEVESKSYFSELGYQYCDEGTYVEIGKNITGSKYDPPVCFGEVSGVCPPRKSFES